MKRRSFDFQSNYSLNKKYEKKEIKRNTIIVDDYYTETNNSNNNINYSSNVININFNTNQYERPKESKKTIMKLNIIKPKSRKNSPTKKVYFSKKIASLFSNFISRKMENEDKKILINRNLNDERTPEQILKDEFNKPTLNNIKNINNIDEEEKRDINKIIINLYQLKEMEKFIKFNGIKDVTLRKAAQFMKYHFFKKDEYIFHEGDKSNIFYGIISGEVSVRGKRLVKIPIKKIKKYLRKNENAKKYFENNFEENSYENSNENIEENEENEENNNSESNENNINEKSEEEKLKFKLEKEKIIKEILEIKDNSRKKYNQKEEEEECIEEEIEIEIIRFLAGWCFGEWAIIYDKPRTAGILCLTDVELFSLSKEHFISTFSKEIVRADIEKKNFVTKKIPHFQTDSIPYLLSSIVPVFYNMGQTVYTENDSANFLYVLYQGECIVKKNIDFNNMKEEDYFNKNDNKNKIYNDRNLKTLFRVGAGCVLGLETIIPNSNYLTNLIASHDFTILYKMKLSELKKFSFEPKFLEPMLKIQIQLIKESIKKEENTFKLKSSLQNKFNLRFGNVNYIVTEFAESVLNEIKNKKEHDKKYKTNLNLKNLKNESLDEKKEIEKEENLFKIKNKNLIKKISCQKSNNNNNIFKLTNINNTSTQRTKDVTERIKIKFELPEIKIKKEENKNFDNENEEENINIFKRKTIRTKTMQKEKLKKFKSQTLNDFYLITESENLFKDLDSKNEKINENKKLFLNKVQNVFNIKEKNINKSSLTERKAFFHFNKKLDTFSVVDKKIKKLYSITINTINKKNDKIIFCNSGVYKLPLLAQFYNN